MEFDAQLYIRGGEASAVVANTVATDSFRFTPTELPVDRWTVLYVPSLLLTGCAVGLRGTLRATRDTVPTEEDFVRFSHPPELSVGEATDSEAGTPVGTLVPAGFNPESTPVPGEVTRITPESTPRSVPGV